MKVLNPKTGKLEEVYLQPGGDTLPIGAIVEIPNGTEIPYGYELVSNGYGEYSIKSSQSITPTGVDLQLTSTINDEAYTLENNKILFQKDGTYLIETEVRLTSSTTNRIISLVINKNNVTESLQREFDSSINNNNAIIRISSILKCNANDKISFFCVSSVNGTTDNNGKIKIQRLV